MTTRTIAVLLSGVLLAATGAGGDTTHPADRGNSADKGGTGDTGAIEPSLWRHNPRGRTEAGLELQNEGAMEAADEVFGTALELAPADPLVRFNAGTADLLGGGDRAIELLGSAAEEAPPELRPLAYYNLGNAQLATEKLPEAIESFKQSLRLDPGNADAKHNLEMALQLLEEQQQQQEEDQQQEQQDQQQEQQNQQQQQSEQQQDEQDQQQQDQEEQEPDQEQQQQQRDQPLPDFEDQPDMTAEQAAAILEAVENLEREQRRKQAMEQLKRAKGDRDW